MTDKEFLNWIADRLVHVYGESSNVDFVHKLRDLAQRQWVGLTDEEKQTAIWSDGGFGAGALWAEAKLKEKNT